MRAGRNGLARKLNVVSRLQPTSRQAGKRTCLFLVTVKKDSGLQASAGAGGRADRASGGWSVRVPKERASAAAARRAARHRRFRCSVRPWRSGDALHRIPGSAAVDDARSAVLMRSPDSFSIDVRTSHRNAQMCVFTVLVRSRRA